MERKDNRVIAVLILGMLAGFATCAILTCLKSLGAITMRWALVLTSFVWATWIIYAGTALVVVIVYLIAKLKRWRRRRKADRRIIAQAKAIGLWEKDPIYLGGRALELKVWEDFKIKREPGETDAHLRYRYALKKIYENTKPQKNKRQQKEGGRTNE